MYRVKFYGLPGPLNDSFTFNTTNFINSNNILPNITNTTITNGSYNQFFEPIPMDMLSFAENISSVIVTVNNIKSTCPNQNC